MFSYFGTKLHITEKPDNTSCSSIFCVSLLAGIGFTMSIFISEIAFSYSTLLIDISKISILGASMLSVTATSIDVNIFNKKNININRNALCT